MASRRRSSNARNPRLRTTSHAPSATEKGRQRSHKDVEQGNRRDHVRVTISPFLSLPVVACSLYQSFTLAIARLGKSPSLTD